MANPITLKREQGLPPAIIKMLQEGDFKGLEKALDNGLPVNLESHGDVPLFEHVLYAIEARNRKEGRVDVPPPPKELVDAFLRNGLAKGSVYDGASTHVLLAAHYGQWELVQRLMDEGFEVEVPGQSALVSMTVGRLLRGLTRGLDEWDREDDEALEEEAQSTAPDPLISGNVHAFPSRLQPSLSIKEDSPSTAASSTQEGGGGILIQDSPAEQIRLNAVVKALVDAGASLEVRVPMDHLDTQAKSSKNFPPLMHAIYHLDGAMVEAMVRAGADLHSRPADLPYRPLELAITRGSVPLVEGLIAAGAPLTPEPSLEGQAQKLAHPLVLCVRMGLPHLIESVSQAMSEEDRKEYGLVAMHVAAANGDIPCMRAVRLQGIPYNAPTSLNGFKPIHQAAFSGNEETLAFLLRRGEQWDSATESGLTAKDILSSHHPHLLERFGMDMPTNVRTLFGRRPKP